MAAVILQLSGHPETQFQAGLAAGCCVLFRLAGMDLDPKSGILRILGCAAAMAIGVMGAAPQLLPFLVQLPDSADWVKHIHGSPEGLSPKVLVLFLAHDFWGRPRAGNGYEGPANYIEAGVGIGMIP